MKGPCYKCENRSVGCHSTCERYISFSRQEYLRKEAIYRSKLKVTATYPSKAQKNFRQRET